jgi:dipeptidyl aminopeptidase/acylaminoacyl peptidase
MKTQTRSQRLRARFGATMMASVLFLVLAGCVTQRIVWSPDGKQAAVLTDAGLYLCDGDGTLSGLLLPDVAGVAWFKDSKRLAVARTQSCTNWQGLAAALSPHGREDVKRGAAGLLAKLQNGSRDQVLEAEREAEKKQLPARLLYLRDEGGGDALKLLAGAKELKGLKADVITLAVAQVSNRAVNVGPILAGEIGDAMEIRISPNGAAIAYTTEDGLSVVEAGGPEPGWLVAGKAAAYPDWSPDGNSLVYITTESTNSAGGVELGVLTRQRVLDDSGRLKIESAKEELAGVLFDGSARVRCLRDGRILFASEEWRLPVTTNDLPQRQQLFALDPERQSTLTALVPHSTHEMLPANLSYFEVSPDEKRVAIGGDKGRVAVFTLATGNVDLVQDATDADLKSIPCWRSASELCYIAIPGAGTDSHKAEVALWENGKTRILSRSWPETARKGLLE